MKATQRRRQWTTLPRPMRARLLLASAVSLALGVVALWPHAGSLRIEADVMTQASLAMEETLDAVRSERGERGLPIDPIVDPNLTGLIGAEFSSLTTTLGQLSAKRTTTNPNTAGLITLLLLDAGVKNGSSVAICASGSFPALIIATLHAVEALGASPLLIVSLSSSMYGANEASFTLLDVLDCYAGRGFTPLAATVGGNNDLGQGLDTQTVQQLTQAIDTRGIPRLTPTTLSDAVSQRMHLFLGASTSGDIDCFVNVGGSWACMGTDSGVLNIPPGLTLSVDRAPPQERRGMIFEFLDRGTPTLHLLNIRDLAADYGLPWDPSPLPLAGEGDLYLSPDAPIGPHLWPEVVWLGAVLAIFAVPIPHRRTPAD